MDPREAVLLASHALAAALGLQTPQAPQLGARGIVHLSLMAEPGPQPTAGTDPRQPSDPSGERPAD
jgi:hypothetical protein